MAIKAYSTLPRAPELALHHQMQFPHKIEYRKSTYNYNNIVLIVKAD